MIIEDIYRQLFGRGGTNKGTDIDMAEHGRVGGVSTGQAFKFADFPDYALKIAKNAGHEVAPNGIVFEVKGEDFEEMYKQLESDYKTWVARVMNYRNAHHIR